MIIHDSGLREVPWTFNKTVTITGDDQVVDPPSDGIYVADGDSVVVVHEKDDDSTLRTLAQAGYHPVRVRFIDETTTATGSYICYREK